MTTERISQIAAIQAMQGTSKDRISQAAVLVGIKIPPPVRTSQVSVVVGSQTKTFPRVSQLAVLVGIGNETAPCLTQEAYAWKITRTDGVEYRYTSHDRDITVKGEVYSPCDGLSSSALELNAEVGSTSGFDISGIITEAKITEIDLWAGIFDGAAIEVWQASWAPDSNYEKLISAGNLAQLDFRDESFTYEVVSSADRLKQRPLLQAVTPSCRFDLFDSRCTVDPAAFTQTGTVDGVTTQNLLTQAKRRQFTDTARAGDADQLWQLGRLTWTTGLNAGQGHDVRAFTAGLFTLETPTRYDIQTGDQYSVTRGCDRTETTCINEFSNGINFGGFPHLKGEDDLNKQAPVK